MTAEVAILNKDAVALAADSAATTGSAKIFNTVNKLFALDKRHPVGVMVYSNAEVMGVPVETVVKEFRRLRDDAPHKHLEHYATEFEEFLRDEKAMFPDDARLSAVHDVVHNAAHTLHNRAIRKVGNDQQGWGHPDATEALAAFESVLSSLTYHVKQSTDVALGQPKHVLEAAIDPAITEAMAFFKQMWGIPPGVQRRVRTFLSNAVFKDAGIGAETGFVIAGFGAENIYPALRSFEFQCSAHGLGIHKVSERKAIDISRTMIAQVEPFAQRDVMESFVEGMDRRYGIHLDRFMEGFFQARVSACLAKKPRRLREAQAIAALGADLATELRDQFARIRQNDFVGPLVDAVASMPKEELAVLAESMINLTSLKRKASQDLETVGGPTDVAVISKGDGFIWIKRKHYFDSKFNPAFVSRYLHEDRNR